MGAFAHESNSLTSLCELESFQLSVLDVVERANIPYYYVKACVKACQPLYMTSWTDC